MLDFFHRLRDEGRLVIVCLHPTARYHLEILREICAGFLLVSSGRVEPFRDFAGLIGDTRVRQYLGSEMTRQAEAVA